MGAAVHLDRPRKFGEELSELKYLQVVRILLVRPGTWLYLLESSGTEGGFAVTSLNYLSGALLQLLTHHRLVLSLGELLIAWEPVVFQSAQLSELLDRH